MDDIFMFTSQQLAIIIRGSIGIANEFYQMKGLGHDEEVYQMTIAAQFQGLHVERELVRRQAIPKAEHQIYPMDLDFLVASIEDAILNLEALPTRTPPEEELMNNLKKLLRDYRKGE
jgi:hypothetical protein